VLATRRSERWRRSSKAIGIGLDVALGGDLGTRPDRTGPIGHRMARRCATVLAPAARHGMTDLRVFGSVARRDERPDSDLDLLVHLTDGAGLFAIGRFADDLEDLLDVSVDVVPDDGLKERVRVNVERDLVPL